MVLTDGKNLVSSVMMTAHAWLWFFTMTAHAWPLSLLPNAALCRVFSGGMFDDDGAAA